jgi:hypothetical protein
MDIKFIDSKLRTKDELNKNDNTYLMSIDFKSANYSSLKTYDEENELFSSWEELCDNLDIHPTLTKSKSFRQYIFGNTSPKRLTKVQHINITKIVDKLIQNHGFEDDDFVFISHDEFIIRLRPSHTLAVNKIRLTLTDVEGIIRDEGINMPIHYRVFKNEVIDREICVQTQYNVKLGGLSEQFNTLFKVPGNIFYFYFKKYILCEPLDKRDLLFRLDGRLAQWTEDSI